ncbi:MAG: response regulator [Erythrobacter sp.]
MKVLYVDDDPDIREIAMMALSLDPQCDARCAPDGASALKMIAAWMPDIVLLDVMMPHLDGPATLMKLREEPRTADLPVVFITARAQKLEIQNFAMLDARGVIAKPFDPMMLSQKVREFL